MKGKNDFFSFLNILQNFEKFNRTVNRTVRSDCTAQKNPNCIVTVRYRSVAPTLFLRENLESRGKVRTGIFFCVFMSKNERNIVFPAKRSEPEIFFAFLYRNSKKIIFFPSFPVIEAIRKIFWLFYIEIRKKIFFPFISGERSP